MIVHILIGGGAALVLFFLLGLVFLKAPEGARPLFWIIIMVLAASGLVLMSPIADMGGYFVYKAGGFSFTCFAVYLLRHGKRLKP